MFTMWVERAGFVPHRYAAGHILINTGFEETVP